MKTTITTGEIGHGFSIGDTIEYRTEDRRWWKRLLHFVTFRSPPVRVVRAKISEATVTTLSVR